MTIAFRNHQGIAMPRSCEVAVKHYQNVARKAIQWWDSGPPGGHYLPRSSYRIADDQGGVYGEGASEISSGLNAHRHHIRDTPKEIEMHMEYMEIFARKGSDPQLFLHACTT